MKPQSLQVVFVSLVQLLRCCISSAQQCKPTKNSEYGYALLSSAYLVLPNEDLGSCYLKCVQDQHCSSINYDLANGKCEHNHVTKKGVPSRFVRKEQSVYAETRDPGTHSCRHLRQMFINETGKEPTDGTYHIYPHGVSKPPVKAYCDMSRDGGGWTLLVTSRNNTWTKDNVLLRNAESPSVTNDYSILKYADDIKNHLNVTGDKFEYRLEANELGHWGGIWEAARSYTFTSTTNLQTNVNLVKKFDNWNYSDSGIEKRMPWVSGEKLTTSRNETSLWWGTITAAMSGYHPAAWIFNNSKAGQNPGTIWYWMREGPSKLP